MPTEVVDVKTANATAPFGYQDPNVYRFLTAPVVLTANLPVASASMDGRIIIEDAGTGDRNLILYAGGQRFRIDGGSNV